MPTKATESLLMDVGSLVINPAPINKEFIYNEDYAPPMVMIPAGTVGVILKRPETPYPGQFQVQFVGHKPYWMHGNEIVPYYGDLAKI